MADLKGNIDEFGNGASGNPFFKRMKSKSPYQLTIKAFYCFLVHTITFFCALHAFLSITI